MEWDYSCIPTSLRTRPSHTEEAGSRLYTFMYMIVDTCNEESTDIQGKCTRLNYLKR